MSKKSGPHCPPGTRTVPRRETLTNGCTRNDDCRTGAARAGKRVGQGRAADPEKAAILAEKDSIVFYLGMKDMVPEALGQSHLDAIIKEEMSRKTLVLWDVYTVGT